MYVLDIYTLLQQEYEFQAHTHTSSTYYILLQLALH